MKTGPLKDPDGGLTAAGRKAYKSESGANLKPGVKDYAGASTADKKRWISWAMRFYGQTKYPPLVKPNGKPTRFALTAAAWGEPVPTTEAQARAIAAKARKRQKELESVAKSGNGMKYPVRPAQKSNDQRSRMVANANRKQPMNPGNVSGKERQQRKMAAQASAAKRRGSGEPAPAPAPTGGKAAAQSPDKQKVLTKIQSHMKSGKPMMLPQQKIDAVTAKAKSKGLKVESDKDGNTTVELKSGRKLVLSAEKKEDAK